MPTLQLRCRSFSIMKTRVDLPLMKKVDISGKDVVV